jgi:hypothetical protein
MLLFIGAQAQDQVRPALQKTRHEPLVLALGLIPGANASAVCGLGFIELAPIRIMIAARLFYGSFKGVLVLVV